MSTRDRGDSHRNTATFAPSAKLGLGLVYTATITTGAKSTNGVPFAYTGGNDECQHHHEVGTLIRLCRATERAHARGRTKESWCTFAPAAAAFGHLERLDEHILARGAVIISPADDDAELLTYVRAGVLARRGPIGAGVIVVGAGELRIAPTPRYARDTNALGKDTAHVFRISIASARDVVVREREQKRFSVADRRGRMCLVVSPDARAGSLLIHQDACVYSALLARGQHIVHALAAERAAWLHVVVGEVALGDVTLRTGDGAGVTAERALSLTSHESSEILLVDLVRA